MKLVTINPDYRGSFFDDGGQALWDKYYEHHENVWAFDSGETMILPDGVALDFLIEIVRIDAWQDEICPILFEEYNPGGEHKTLDEIRKAEQ